MSTITSRTAPLMHVTYFACPGGTAAKCAPRDDSPAGHRAVGLRGLRPVPGRLRQLPGPGPFREVTPVVPVNGGRKPPGTADAGRL